MWLVPVAILAVFMALLGTMYLDYVVDPEENLHDFPIALVNQDVGDSVGAPGEQRWVRFGDEVTDGLKQAVPADKIDLQVVAVNEASQRMQDNRVYGTIVIPSDFSKRLGILGAGSVIPGDIQRPIITLQTNPRSGAFVTEIVTQIGNRALAEVNKQVGAQLTEQVRAQLTPPPGGPPAPELTGAARVALAEPLHIVVEPFHPLPSGTGRGLTAFFYALLLLLAGLVGSMTIHTMIDAQLGFVPTEYGPWFVHFPPTPISRFHTLLIKWGVMVVTANVVAGVFLAVADALGMPIDHPLGLFLFSALAIIAVGVTGLSVLAAVGSAGLLINLILFIILGLPSSGGTVPIEATPKYLGWLANFEPMHQVFLGVRSILYFDSSGPAGLSRGVWMAALGLAIGLVLGVVITRFYDRKGLRRSGTGRRETV
ncbi:YhgE/Pip-like protein [Nocardia tenerifensis]|uniref:YhgE/Pip-like protein n=1 Tax=Nocardia tenerifensis TaxID=228006 RepID=A0A318JSN7_9NOCA|nr:ABC transporter permease [Nocardia tenerifensis]PXX52854.1 YhgE/Pip-like protein [Nocardia tenerifensis]